MQPITAPRGERRLPAEPGPFYEMLWDGSDQAEVGSVSPDLVNKTFKRSGEGKVFVILGPEDSGTNLMQYIITSNFDGLISSQRQDGEIWKHSNNGADNLYRELAENMKDQTFEETAVVMMIRSPVSQICSWKSHPYDMRSCVSRPYAEMNRPCKPTLSACIAGHPELHRTVEFSSTVDVYNHYLEQYQQILADKQRFMDVHLFAYEDVVYSPEDVVHVLAKVFGKPVPDVITLPEHSVKGGAGSGRAKALEKIEKRLYLEQVSNAEKEILCQGLDYNRADTIIQGSFFSKGDPRQTSHSYDCR
mmetsp:Transcript_5175/g.15205  ORF Transcript_5175/g.15205 Transcript_5175/m.15205 type:complete len:304 (-) Transcript_5175:52-963(-)